MDTLSAGSKGEMSYQPYLYTSSCGKFLSTLLYLTLRKANALEAFRLVLSLFLRSFPRFYELLTAVLPHRWNIRVELSRPVYRELHRISTLKTLHVRMQAGDSYYMPPPPLPISFQTHHPPPPPPVHFDFWGTPPPPSLPSLPVLPHPPTGTSPPVLNGPPPLHSHSRSTSNNRFSKHHPQEPPRLSGFKNLKSLSILDIDDLGVIPELRACVKHSYSTLGELQLSLSSSMASQSRKPPPDSDTDDSDQEYFDDPPASHHSNFDNVSPARAFRAQEERKKQEAILGRVLGVEANLQKKPQMQLGPDERDRKGKSRSTAPVEDADPREQFVSSLRGVSTKLMSIVNGSKDVSATHQDILDAIEKAARKYVDSAAAPGTPGGDSTAEGKADKGPSGENLATSSTAKTEASVSDEQDHSKCKGKGKDDGTSRTVSSEAAIPTRPKMPKDSSPDDIDIEHPDMVDDAADESDEQIDVASGDAPIQDCKATTGEASHSSRANPTSSVHQPAAAKSGENTPLEQDAPAKYGDSRDALQISMDDYIRDTRGLSLAVLKIHLIPVKASVFSRAINMGTLKELTLLNVGNQTPIWTLLAKENRTQPLALRSIFTDNVSAAFLTLVSQLKEIHDLFMLERNVDHKPESFAPRASITIDQIRRLVLKKHISTLRRLMIKDESKEANWDANEKAMILICTQGRQLEELAVSMNIHAVVSNPISLCSTIY